MTAKKIFGRPLLQKVIVSSAVVGLVGGLGFLGLSWHPAILPVSPPKADSFSPESIQRGANVARAGFCSECHTRTDGQRGAPLAGDYAMKTPFGTFYSSNITPDPETGIGTWSEAAFKRSMRHGIARDGQYLYAVFPYNHFTHMTDQDISDVYAWLMTRPAVKQQRRSDSLLFPLTFRRLQWGWQLLFFKEGVYKPNPQKDALWNRGAYLASGASHCGACHTPHNMLGSEIASRAYDGAVIDDWIAPALNENNPSPTPWTEPELYDYLRTGAAPLHGVVAGPMAPVVHEGYAQLPEEDAHAVAVYFADLDHAAQRTGQDQAAFEHAMNASGKDMSGPFIPDTALKEHNSEGAQFIGAGMRLTRVTCAACHANFGSTPAPGRPELALSSALWLPEPTNLYQIMLRGFRANEGKLGWVMPSYYAALSNKQMAEIAAYLRATRTTLPPWTDLEKKAAEVRATVVPPPLSVPLPKPSKDQK